MNTAIDNMILFVDSIDEYDFSRYTADHIMHILCLEGSMSLVFHNVHYNIGRGDYIIISNLAMASDFSTSPDCKCIIMSFAEIFFISMAIHSKYGFIGRFALLQNPVIKLSATEFEKCKYDLVRLRDRVAESNHLFHEEMTGHLLLAHALDLYDIHARKASSTHVPERATLILQRFIDMLYRGDFISHRNLEYYASALCITPHYLSELCKNISGEPASYWIDRFTIHEAINLLSKNELSLADIAERLNFSSLSYFSRYIQRHIGLSPSAYRNSFLK